MTEEQNTQKETNLETGSDITTYIKNFKEQVKKGLGEDASLAGPIDLEMSTTLEKKGEGGVFISVLKAGASVKHEEVHKVRIPIKFISEADKKEEQARIVKAEAERKEAENKKLQSETSIKWQKGDFY